MFVRANFVDIYLQGMRDRSMRSGTELAREIKLTDWSMAGNLSNRSSGVQIPRDICTHLKRYLYSAKCSCIISHFLESVLKGLRHGILSYFDHRRNYLEIERNLKIILYKLKTEKHQRDNNKGTKIVRMEKIDTDYTQRN